MKISTITSTYNSAKFLAGCLDSLIAQALAPFELEIIVVNSGSKQHEGEILRNYMQRDSRIKVITSLREPLYASWNRAVRLATGDYCVICNADDRFAPHALATLAQTLNDNPDVGLVYADCYVTPTENAVWNGDYTLSYEAPYTTGRLNWPDFDPQTLLQHYYIGPQFMWRRVLCQQYGVFDANYQQAGDYEFVLRLAACGVRFKRINEVLGLFYWNAAQQGRANAEQVNMESRRALLQWRGEIQRLNYVTH